MALVLDGEKKGSELRPGDWIFVPPVSMWLPIEVAIPHLRGDTLVYFAVHESRRVDTMLVHRGVLLQVAHEIPD